MSEDAKKNTKFTKEDLEALNADIIAAKGTIDEEALKRAEEAGKQKALDEIARQKEIDTLKAEKDALAKELEDSKKASLEAISKIEEKVNEMATSKQPVPKNDPFAPPEGSKKTGDDSDNPDNWSDEKVDAIELNSAKSFFGEEAYDDMLRGTTR